MNSRWQEIERIYSAAADLPAERRETFVRREADRPELGDEILGLLAAGGDESVPPRPVDLQDLLTAFSTNFLSGRSLGPYDVADLLGAGGMGLVFRAVDRRHGNTVAIKVLPPEQTRHPGRVARLMREAQTLSKLNHPSIVRILETGSEGQLHYLAMEYAEGETLRRRLNAGPLNEAEARALGVSIAGALAEAHASGVTHRDLKPDNIILTEKGVKLLDFGIAHLDDAENPGRTTLTDAMSGTVAYLAPEQIEGSPAKPAGDLFALGVVLFEATTGRHPFQRANPVATAAAIVREQPPLNLVPPGLRPVVGRCLQKKAARRYSSAAEIVADLNGSGRPMRSKPRVWAAVGIAAALSVGAWVALSRGNPASVLAGPGNFDNPAVSGDGKWVAYASKSHIWAQPAGGGQRAVQVSFRPGKDSWPSLSPDGQTVIYRHEGEPSGIYRVRLRDGKAAGPEEFLTAGYKPKFSPSGRKIAFEHNPISATDPDAQPPELRVVDSNGPFTAAVPLQLIDGFIQPEWFWSPGGDEALLAIMAYRGSQTNVLFRVDSNGGKCRLIRERDAFTDLSSCGALASGAVVGVNKAGDLVDTSGQAGASLSRNPRTPSRRVTGCQVLAGGRVAAFLNDARREIWELKGDTIHPRLSPEAARPTGLETGFPVSVSYDGRWLAWVQENVPLTRALLLDPSGKEIELAHFDGDPWGPKMAPDGSAVLMHPATPVGKVWEILSLPDRKLVRRIEVESIVWSVSKGTRWLLTVGTPSLPRSVGVLNTDTRVMHTILLDPKLNLYLAALSPDERWVIFTTEERGMSRVYVAAFNPDRLTPREQWIEIGLGDYPAWSPGGNQIYYLAPEQDRILSVAFDGAAGRRGEGDPLNVYRFAPGWGLRGLSPGQFRIAVTPDRVLFNLAHRQTVVEVVRN